MASDDEVGDREKELLLREIELLKREKELYKREQETARSTLTLRDVEDGLPKFNGTYSVEKWVTEIEENSKLFGWDDLLTLVCARKLLHGTAKTWLESKPLMKTWKLFKAEIIAEFSKRMSSAEVHRMLSKRKQQSGESLQEYLLNMSAIANKCDMEEESLVEYIIDGISDVEVNKMMLYQAKTMSELKTQLITYEKMISKSKNVDTRRKFEVRRKTDDKKGSNNCFNCGEAGHQKKDCKEADKGPRCYKCRKYGHIAAKCGNAESKSPVEERSSMQIETKPADLTDITYKNVIIEQREVRALFDTGSCVSVIRFDEYVKIGSPEMKPNLKCLSGLGRNEIQTLGCFDTQVVIDGDSYDILMHVVDQHVMKMPCIIGKELLNQASLVINKEGISIKRLEEYEIMHISLDVEKTIDVGNQPCEKEIAKLIEGCKPKSQEENEGEKQIEEDGIKARIKKAQKEDLECKAIIEETENGLNEDYSLKGGILHKFQNGKDLLVIPKKMQNEIIRKCHEIGHFGIKKTKEAIALDYYIPKLEKKIKRIIENCVPCILVAPKTGKPECLLNPIDKSGGPLDTLHIDHLGPLPSTHKNYKHLLAIVDGFTKYLWLFPTKTTNAKEVVDKLKNIQGNFGNPRRIVSDRGAAFRSREFEEFLKEESIQHCLITSGVPRGNGQVERIHHIVTNVLAKLSVEDPTKWYKYVADVQRFINSTHQRSIQTTPFELLIGTPMRNKEQIRLKELIEEENQRFFQEGREELRVTAKRQIEKVQAENQKNYNKRRKKARTYEEGDLVAIKRTQFGTGLKLYPKYLGPYRVTIVDPKDRYVVEHQGSSEGPRRTTCSADLMKPWQGILDNSDSDDSESAGEDEDNPPITEDEEDDHRPAASEADTAAGRPSCGIGAVSDAHEPAMSTRARARMRAKTSSS